jgi:hypothetical protein
MPWCDECAKFWSPPSLRDGDCPTCGTQLEIPTAPPDDAEHPKAPWHFKLLLVALILYLGYRAYQGVDWVAHWAPKHL